MNTKHATCTTPRKSRHPLHSAGRLAGGFVRFSFGVIASAVGFCVLLAILYFYLVTLAVGLAI